MTAAIELHGVRLSYKFYSRGAGTMKEHAINLFKGQGDRRTLWALDGVDLTVAPGDVLGVIGPNGAGKSTMMKVIARVLMPTEGRVIVRGNVAAMIALGAGFNADATARENIVLFGTLLGRTPAEMRRRVMPILEWAELTDFVDAPLRTFSSGMVGRLGFSVASDASADVLLVDEVLSVGDRAFRRKSEERMRSMVESGSAVVVVSHAMNTIKTLCTKVLWLDRGQVQMLGPTDEVIAAYEGPESGAETAPTASGGTEESANPARPRASGGRPGKPQKKGAGSVAQRRSETAGRSSDRARPGRAGGEGQGVEAPHPPLVDDAESGAGPVTSPSDPREVPTASGVDLEARVIVARSYDDAQLLADCIRTGVPAVLDLRTTDPASVVRIADFAIGLTYALGGAMRKIGPGVVLVTPIDVDLGPEERRRLTDLGYFASTGGV